MKKSGYDMNAGRRAIVADLEEYEADLKKDLAVVSLALAGLRGGVTALVVRPPGPTRRLPWWRRWP